MRPALVALLVADAVAIGPAVFVAFFGIFLTDDPANAAWSVPLVLAIWSVVPLIGANAAAAIVALLRFWPSAPVLAWLTAIGPVLGLAEGVTVAVMLSRP